MKCPPLSQTFFHAGLWLFAFCSVCWRIGDVVGASPKERDPVGVLLLPDCPKPVSLAADGGKDQNKIKGKGLSAGKEVRKTKQKKVQISQVQTSKKRQVR